MYTATPNWKDVADGGYRLAVEELAVSPSCWARACEVMGREIATIAIAIVSTKESGEITTSPARYFAGMVKLAVDGKLNLARSLWGAREARFGKPDRKRPN